MVFAHAAALIFTTRKECFVNFNEDAGPSDLYGIFCEELGAYVAEKLLPVNPSMLGKRRFVPSARLEGHLSEVDVVSTPVVTQLEDLKSIRVAIQEL